jgi:hypothetical protein
MYPGSGPSLYLRLATVEQFKSHHKQQKPKAEHSLLSAAYANHYADSIVKHDVKQRRFTNALYICCNARFSLSSKVKTV